MAFTQPLRNYFREKAMRSLNAAGFEVISDSSIGSPVPVLISGYLLGSNGDFVNMSQRVADHLYNSQTGVNSPGLICVMEVDISGVRGIAILKLDKNEAVHIEQVSLNGNATFDLRHVKDLILSSGTRVFKAGLFYA